MKKSFHKNHVIIGVSRISLVMASMLIGYGPAYAQDEQGAGSEQDIIVTGTSIRGIEPPGSQTITLDRKGIEATGITNVTDLMRTIPQVQGLGYGESPSVAQGGGSNQQRGTSVNLRGLGNNATLLLLDGNRVVPSGTVGTFTEANIVPVSAIERVEVVADGASAIYGSDAVAGVVNYVLRRDFSGLEANARYTSSRYWDQYGAYVMGGAKWSLGDRPGNLLVVYDYDRQNPMIGNASPYIRQDLRQFGGNDLRIQGNSVTQGDQTNIVVAGTTPNPVLSNAGNFRYYTVAAGATGVPAAGSLLVNQPSVVDILAPADYIQKTDRHQAVIVANQELTDWLHLNFTGVYSGRFSDSRSRFQGSYTVPATSPFYIAGVPGVAPGAPLDIRYGFFKDLGWQVAKNNNEMISLIPKLEVDFGSGWRGSATLNYARDVVDRTQNYAVNNTAFQSLINSGAINPFDTRPLDPSLTARFTGDFLMRSETKLRDIVIKADGPVFDLPAGSVRAAIGGEFIKTSNAYKAGSPAGAGNVFALTANAYAKRKIDAFFGEFYVPLISDDMNIPTIRRLSLDMALRTERYSDFGRTTNPRIGAEWEIAEGFKLRGSWSTSFRAPGLASINPGIFSASFVTNTVNNSGIAAIPVDVPGANLTRVLVFGGSNPDLKPEKSTAYSFGFDIAPPTVPGLRLSATYFNYRYRDQIAQLFINSRDFLASRANAAAYASFITPTPTPAGCVEGNPSTYNPNVAAGLLMPNNGPIPALPPFCTIRAVLDARDQNASKTIQDGIDMSIAYNFDVNSSRFDISASGSYLLNVKTALTPGAPMIQRVNTINYPVSFRGRAGVAWTLGQFNANLFANYIGSYTNNLPITVSGVTRPIRKVPSWTTFDLTLAYSIKSDGFLNGIRASVSAQNLFDRDPPVVLSVNGGNAGYGFDNQVANPFGRIMRFSLTKVF